LEREKHVRNKQITTSWVAFTQWRPPGLLRPLDRLVVRANPRAVSSDAGSRACEAGENPPPHFTKFNISTCFCLPRKVVNISVLSTNGAVTSRGQDLEHVGVVVKSPTASFKAIMERIFANIIYAVKFSRIRIRRIFLLRAALC
jgi:hypothetical protein